MSNIKYQKRWRGNFKNTYWFIDPRGNIDFTLELFTEIDGVRYEIGNYFRTKEEAQNVVDSKEWQKFWANAIAGEIKE